MTSSDFIDATQTAMLLSILSIILKDFDDGKWIRLTREFLSAGALALIVLTIVELFK